jgi:hypothetical protein
MSRGAYDQTLTCYHSAGPFTPGAVKFTAFCRVVFLDSELDYDSVPFTSLNGYATYTGPKVSAGNVAPTANGFDLRLYLNDVVEFSDLPGVFWQVWFSQIVHPRIGLSYRRIWFSDSL